MKLRSRWLRPRLVSLWDAAKKRGAVINDLKKGLEVEDDGDDEEEDEEEEDIKKKHLRIIKAE